MLTHASIQHGLHLPGCCGLPYCVSCGWGLQSRRGIRRCAGWCVQVVRINLKGAEVSDYLNFVLKDETTGTWYDLHGGNFHVPLKEELRHAADEALASMDNEDVAPLMPLDRIPQLPQVRASQGQSAEGHGHPQEGSTAAAG